MKYITKCEVHTEKKVFLKGEIIDEELVTSRMKELCLAVPFKSEMLTEDSSDVQVETDEKPKGKTKTKNHEKDTELDNTSKEEKDE